jgi:hypothetical protein
MNRTELRNEVVIEILKDMRIENEAMRIENKPKKRRVIASIIVIGIIVVVILIFAL